tara:strand:+ start:31 stop:195 length:165 start_codon:yes stop_codon:yes gene_type:complete
LTYNKNYNYLYYIIFDPHHENAKNKIILFYKKNPFFAEDFISEEKIIILVLLIH